MLAETILKNAEDLCDILEDGSHSSDYKEYVLTHKGWLLSEMRKACELLELPQTGTKKILIARLARVVPVV